MNTAVKARVREILESYSPDYADVAWLLCDRHPADRVALTVVEVGARPAQLTYGELAEDSRRVAAMLT